MEKLKASREFGLTVREVHFQKRRSLSLCSSITLALIDHNEITKWVELCLLSGLIWWMLWMQIIGCIDRSAGSAPRQALRHKNPDEQQKRRCSTVCLNSDPVLSHPSVHRLHPAMTSQCSWSNTESSEESAWVIGSSSTKQKKCPGCSVRT